MFTMHYSMMNLKVFEPMALISLRKVYLFGIVTFNLIYHNLN